MTSIWVCEGQEVPDKDPDGPEVSIGSQQTNLNDFKFLIILLSSEMVICWLNH